MVTYYENGHVKTKGNYKDGKKDGLWENYIDEKLVWRVNYKYGKEEGLWEYFNEDGSVEETENYKDGKLVD